MIKVTAMNNVTRTSLIVEENKTPREILEEVGIDYTRGTVHLDGAPLMPGDLDKSFADFGIRSKCYLTSIVKVDNA